ncbi:MAG TPA: NDP-sugar synthase [Candidatus Thermoplasmatota archaeon]|nr:NDP-sugar synthase [Candidatus Thermoplasmatota archaeon]
MEAIVLAGGFGTRLRPLTLTQPKPLLPLANVPLLDRVIASMPPEVDKVVVAVNYMADEIRRHFRDRPPGIETEVVLEDRPLGTGGAIKNCQSHVEGTFVVRNADLYDTLDLTGMLAFHRKEDALATISLWPVDEPQHFGVVELDGTRIRRFVEKPPREEAPSNLINAGTYILEPEVLDRIPGGKQVSIEAEIYPQVVSTPRGMRGYNVQGYWIDCGRPETYLEAHKQVLSGAQGGVVVGKDAVVEGRLQPWAAVGDRCTVARGARVFEGVLLEGTTLEAGAHVLGSIVGRNCRIGAGAGVLSSVLGDNVTVKPGARIVGTTVDPGKQAG